MLRARGETDISPVTAIRAVAGKASATMKSTCYAIKATVKLPTTITTVNRIELKTSNEESLNVFGWTTAGQFMFGHKVYRINVDMTK